MSLDITIKERKEYRCPDCGRLVTTQDIGAEYSDGRVWYEFLQVVGYYVEGDKQPRVCYYIVTERNPKKEPGWWIQSPLRTS